MSFAQILARAAAACGFVGGPATATPPMPSSAASTASAAVAVVSRGSLEDRLIAWSLDDIEDGEARWQDQLQPLPDTFAAAGEWAGLLQPFLLLETQAGLRQALEQLGSAKWLPLDGVPELRRDDRRGGGGGRDNAGLGGVMPPPPAKATVVFSVRRQDRGGGGGAGGDWRAARAVTASAGLEGGLGGGGSGWKAKKPPPLKPTDIVLLVNAHRIPDLASLRRSDVLWVLGVVQRGPSGEGDEEDDEGAGGGGFFNAVVRVDAGSALAAALDGGGAAASAGGGSLAAPAREWYAVPVGNIATDQRVWDALLSLAGPAVTSSGAADVPPLPPPPPPPMLQLLLGSSDGSCSSSGSSGAGAAGLSGSTRAYVDAVSAAARHYASTVRRLNPSQQDAVVRAAVALAARSPASSAAASDAEVGMSSSSSTGGSSGGGSSGGGGRAELQLVQGPPGTGKTSTTAAQLSVLAAVGRPGTALLATAPTNAAVGEIASRFVKLVAAGGQQFADSEAAEELRRRGLRVEPPLLPGDIVLLGSGDRLDLAGSPELLAVFLQARAKRLSAALATWTQAPPELRRLLTYPCQVHADALRAAEAAATAATAAASEAQESRRQAPRQAPTPLPPPSRCVGEYLKQRLPPLLRALAAAAWCLLADLPSAAWGPGSSGNSSRDCGSSDSMMRTAGAAAMRASNRAAVQSLAAACRALASGLAAAAGAADVARAAAEVERRGAAADSHVGARPLPSSASASMLVSSMEAVVGAMDTADMATCRRTLAATVPRPSAARSGGGPLFGYCLSKARAIFATVAAVGSPRMAAAPPVEAAVVDEAAQLPEAHLAVPMALCGGGSLALLVLVTPPIMPIMPYTHARALPMRS